MMDELGNYNKIAFKVNCKLVVKKYYNFVDFFRYKGVLLKSKLFH